MRICYVDEAGDLGALPSATSKIQPVFVVAAASVARERLAPLTHDFLGLKKRFFPKVYATSYLDTVLAEVKGAELRKAIALGSRDERRHAVGFLDKSLRLLAQHQVRLFARIWIKGIGVPIDGRAVYTYSMQDICASFQKHLAACDDIGFVIADSRNKPANAQVAHSIFTQMFRTAGNPYDRIVEMPTFGHSDNHVGIQIADLLCSALLFPMAIHTYCVGHVSSLHVRPGYQEIKDRFTQAIRDLQFRYQEPVTGKWRGGVTVADAIAHRSSAELFK